jgi:hypothetical protein
MLIIFYKNQRITLVLSRIVFSTLFLVSFFVYPLIAQVSIASRLGASTFNELQFEVLAAKNDKISLYASMSYFYRGFNLNGPGCGTPWPATLYDKNNSGIGLKFGFSKTKIKIKKDKEKIKRKTFALLYRRFGGKLHVNDSGCGEYWTDYNFTANDIGFYHYNDSNINKAITFYSGFGLVMRIKNQYSITTNPLSSVAESKVQFRLLFDLGFRIRLYKSPN